MGDGNRLREIEQALNDRQIIMPLLREIESSVKEPLKFMEVCGTHTMAIFESGLRTGLESLGISLISGPGCPVCVTDQVDIDHALHIAESPDVIFTSFGDMLKVPGTKTSLDQLKALGADIRIVYSPLDALRIAENNPAKMIVFFAIGFETTIPAIAASLEQAIIAQIENYYLFTCHKTIPGPLRLLAEHPKLNLDGFILPGHVSAVIGARAYEEFLEKHPLPLAITGFQPVDILRGVLSLVKQHNEDRPQVANVYERAVTDSGNIVAKKRIDTYFQASDVIWRGLGEIPQSGLSLREEYQHREIRNLVDGFIPYEDDESKSACRCGEVIIGLIKPAECECFGAACTPDHPLGACMVSQEGSCRAYYRFSDMRY